MRKKLAAALALAVGFLSLPALAAEPALFASTHAISTKTGFRAVFAWETTQPVRALVHFGTDPANLDRKASPAVDGPDTAGIAVADIADADLGKSFYYQIEDQLSGEKSEIGDFVATNAYNDYNGSIYTIDLLVQLDSQSLDPSIPYDQALEDIAQGISIMAERTYDALDGKARVGKVIVTDTNLAYGTNVPGSPQPIACAEGNVADVLVTTAPPMDSHTWAGWSIGKKCVSYYVGRVGWLGVAWADDLMFGHVGAHEFMHYAFNAPDLYGPLTDADCINPAWDGSLMHNTGGFEGGKWVNTELDRNPTLTPCDHGTQPYSWDNLRERYTEVPENPTGPIEHVVDDKARGNEDGGALEIIVLDREPGASTLEVFTPNDTDEPDPDPLVCSASGPVVTDPEGDAKQVGLTGGSTYEQGVNEPGLDIRSLNLGWNASSETLTFDLQVSDLAPTNPETGPAVAFNVNFDYEGDSLYVEAARGPTGEKFRLGRFVSSTRTHLRDITGAFDSDSDTVRLELTNTQLANIGSTALVDKDELSGIEAVSRRGVSSDVATAGLSADTTDEGCAYTIGHGAGRLPSDAEPDGSISLASPKHSWNGHVLADAVVPFTGTNSSGCTQAADDSDCERQIIHVTAPSTGAPIKFTVSSGDPDGFMIRVYGPDGTMFGEAGTLGDESATVNGTATQTGLYTVVLRPWSAVDATYNAYAYIGTEPPPLPDATLSTETPTFSWNGDPRTKAAVLDCSDEGSCESKLVDVIPAEGGSQVTITAVADNPEVNDIDLYVYDSTGKEVISSAHNGGNEALTFRVNTRGTYTVVVQFYATIESGYEAEASLNAPLPPPPPDAEFDGEISLNGSYSWEGDPPADVSPVSCTELVQDTCDNTYIKVNVPTEGAKLTVKITANKSGDSFSVYVYDPAGTQHRAGTSGGTFTLNVTQSGIYRIGITTGLVPATGTYSGIVSLIPK